VSPLLASFGVWGLWVASWVLAAVWSRQTLVRGSVRTEVLIRIPTSLGGLLLFLGSPLAALSYRPAWGGLRLWTLPPWAGWAMTGLCAAAFAFAWWARLELGDLWAGTVSRKQDHEIVERGPYAVVRHPIYTGILGAAFALAIQIGMLANLIGAALLAVGFWLRARAEERFLAAQLGEPAYRDYRARTPMLMPFWPRGR
jgi:protein-S-isoprenylcysteine O-methyltransferase Ste14